MFDPRKILIMQRLKDSTKWQDVIPQIHSINHIKNHEFIEIINHNDFRISCNGVRLKKIKLVVKFDTYYKVFFSYNNYTRVYLHNDLKFTEKVVAEASIKNIRNYFDKVLDVKIIEEEKNEQNKQESDETTEFKPCSKHLKTQLSELTILPESIFAKLLDDDHTQSTTDYSVKIFPFRVNHSQKIAVKNALENDISIIQGPPGTGKTETILNIIANLILREKCVAVVSGTNTAIENVQEKLKKGDFLKTDALLGNNDNVQDFFSKNKVSEQVAHKQISIVKEEDKLRRIDDLQDDYLKLDFELKELANKLYELERESELRAAEFGDVDENSFLKKDFLGNKYYKKEYSSCMYLRMLALFENSYSKMFSSFVSLFFKYKIKYSKSILERRSKIIVFLQHKYYIKKKEEVIAEREKKIVKICKLTKNRLFRKIEGKQKNKAHFTNDKELNCNVFSNTLLEYSQRIFRQTIQNRCVKCAGTHFTYANYKSKFKQFVFRYPIIYSTTHSLKNCSGEDGFLYDYLIIDESSMTDMITAMIAMSCAKRVVLVGDNMQLHHVVKSNTLDELDECFFDSGLPNAFDYVKNNILQFVLQKKPNAVQVLLNEHYRCDPEIVGFCNKRFYNDQLVICTEHKEKCGLTIMQTEAHSELDRKNDRQAQCARAKLKEIVEESLKSPVSKRESIGIIAPFTNQVDHIKSLLGTSPDSSDEVSSVPESKGITDEIKRYVESTKTVHKFQGQERDHIIFSTTVDRVEIYNEDNRYDFANQPNLINVAISRAKNNLYLIASKKLLEQTGSLVNDLQKYYSFYCERKTPDNTMKNIYSIFDLMYEDYSPYLEDLKRKVDKLKKKKQNSKNTDKEKVSYESENIFETVLDEFCSSKHYGAYAYKVGYPFRKIINADIAESPEDLKFINNINTHCDFVIYSKMDKSILLCIEVDGKQHSCDDKQLARDERKDRLVKLAGLKMYRIKTTDCVTAERVKQILNQYIDSAIRGETDNV